MDFTNIANSGSNIINTIVEKIIFWREWDIVSSYMLLGIIGLVVLVYWFLKKSVADLKPKKHNSIFTRKRR